MTQCHGQKFLTTVHLQYS